MIYFALFMTGAFLIGFLMGIALKAFLDRDEVIDLEKKNARLHAQLAEAKRKNVETIKIIDPTVGQYIDFPNSRLRRG